MIAEETLPAMKPPPRCTDRALSAILWRPAVAWEDEEVREYLSRRAPERVERLDPRCKGITHYRRCGRHALYEFLCLLSSREAPEQVAPFWVSYVNLCALPEARAHLDAKGWFMRDYFKVYSDGEEVWDSGGDSCDEQLAERRRTRGRPHELVKVRQRSQRVP